MAGVVHKGYNSISEVSLDAFHLSGRKIFLNGQIDEGAANLFLKQTLYLSEDKENEIDIYLNSPDGEINSGLMICDLIMACRIPVNIYCTGLAASMAAVILACGEKNRRFILPHSKTMIHEPLLSGNLHQSASSIQNLTNSLLQTKTLMNSILAQQTGRTLDEIEQATLYDHYLDAEETVHFGLCDQIRNITL